MNTPQVMLSNVGAHRADWSPNATPAAHDFLAHTPDPTKYHGVGGRTMIPRSDKLGGSLAFKPNDPVIVNIDPTDPGTGKGGLSVDLAQVSKQAMAAAVESTPDALSAWANLAQQHAAGYSGAPAVAPAVAAPVAVVPAPLPALAPLKMGGPPAIFSTSPTAPVQVAAPVAQSQDVVNTLIAQVQQLGAELLRSRQEQQDLSARFAQWYEEGNRAAQVAVQAAPAAPAAPPSVVHQFVAEPQRPGVPVVFDLGVGGVHRVHFHHVSVRGSSIFLFYDGRYTEGYRFLPPVTPDGQTIKVTVTGPGRDERAYDVVVLPLNNTLDYIDIVQLLTVEKGSDVPPMQPMYGASEQDLGMEL